jgi:hypothetical protein
VAKTHITDNRALFSRFVGRTVLIFLDRYEKGEQMMFEGQIILANDDYLLIYDLGEEDHTETMIRHAVIEHIEFIDIIPEEKSDDGLDEEVEIKIVGPATMKQDPEGV